MTSGVWRKQRCIWCHQKDFPCQHQTSAQICCWHQLGFFLQGQLVVFRALTDFSNASCNVAPVLLNYSDFHIYSKQTRLLTKQSCFVNCELLDCVVVQWEAICFKFRNMTNSLYDVLQQPEYNRLQYSIRRCNPADSHDIFTRESNYDNVRAARL